jgi:Family of unknown function (DUF6502)
MPPVRQKFQAGDPIREAAVDALKHVVDSLLELMFDSGVTVQQFNYLLRDRAVRVATRRVIKDSGRNSRSRVAIITGLPRSEVTRISASPDSYTKTKLGQHPARRVLAAWFDDPQFLTPAGEPATLPIFGKRRSFDHLVYKYGSGIPVRAMLDELIQLGAVEPVADQRVRPKSRVPISVGLTADALDAIGERCGDLLQTLINNSRRSMPTLFEATSLTSNADLNLVPIIRREIAEQGASFINGASSLLRRSQSRLRSAPAGQVAKCRLGVTVYYFEDPIETITSRVKDEKLGRRTNLRRQQASIKKRAPSTTKRH